MSVDIETEDTGRESRPPLSSLESQYLELANDLQEYLSRDVPLSIGVETAKLKITIIETKWINFETKFNDYHESLQRYGASHQSHIAQKQYAELRRRTDAAFANLRSIIEPAPGSVTGSVRSERDVLQTKFKIAQTKGSYVTKCDEVDLQIKKLEQQKNLLKLQEEKDIIKIQMDDAAKLESHNNSQDLDDYEEEVNLRSILKDSANYNYDEGTAGSRRRYSTPQAPPDRSSSLNPNATGFTPGRYSSQRQSFTPSNSVTLDSTSRHLSTLDLKRTCGNPYNGDPFMFSGWFRSLKNRLEPLNLSPLDVIDILEAQTSGAPREVVQTFKVAYGNNPRLAMDTIFDKLKKRFGDSTEIANELRHKLTKFPEIRGTENDPKVASSLRKLSDLCLIIRAHLDSVEDLQTLNFPSGLELVRSKLPDFINNLWRVEKASFVSRNFCHPDFCWFSKFLENQADILCSDLSSSMLKFNVSKPAASKSNYPNQNKVKPMYSLVTGNSSNDTFKCPLHKSNSHEIKVCTLFESMNYKAKRQLITNFELCYKCLGQHMITDCSFEVNCEKCNATNHLTIMHKPNYDSRPRQTHSYSSSQTKPKNRSFLSNRDKEPSSTLQTNILGKRFARSCGKTVLVDISAPHLSDKVLRSYVILDDQSEESFAASHLFDYFNIKSSKIDYRLQTMTHNSYKLSGRIAEGLLIKGVYENHLFDLPRLFENNFIPNTKHDVATSDVVESFDQVCHLANRFPPFDETAPVSLLLGRDAGDLIITTAVVGDKAPAAYETRLGWALVGMTCPESKENDRIAEYNSTVLFTRPSHEHFKASIEFPRSYNVFKEHIGDDLEGMSVEDRKFCDLIGDNISINNEGHLEMPLPLKNMDYCMPDNKRAVHSRQYNTLKRLHEQPVKMDACIKFMDNIMESNHVEKIAPNEIKGEFGKSWHLPVFPVEHPKKKKVRLVFDSAASYGGVSLNSSLLKGPDQNNSLRGVLLRFREDKVGFVADVASMFHSFHVTPEHRDLLRFFWYEDNNPQKDLALYRARVHIFGNTCSPAIATIALRRAADSLLETEVIEKSVKEKAHRYIYSSFYVDDGLGAASTPEEAVEVLSVAKDTLSQFNIRLHKIVASNSTVMNAFPESERGEVTTVEFDNTSEHRTLGVVWDISSDSFTVKVDVKEKQFTKRGILSVINSVFDPIGLASPVVLGGRLLQRKILPRKTEDNRFSNYDWDDELPSALLDTWNSWKKSLSSLHSLTIPRCFIPLSFSEVTKTSLHVFCDASEDAIGHVVYLKSESSDSIHVAFVYGESKVSPRQATSIPRLELCAAVEAAQSAYRISQELSNKPHETLFYTDSKVVLGYIRNETRRFSQYVSRRIEMIHNITSFDQWHYIHTKANPADLATRPTDAITLSKSIWFTGPAMLWNNNDSSHDNDESVVADLELLPEQLMIAKSLVTQANEDPVFSNLFKRTNNFNKMVRITRNVFMFIGKLHESLNRPNKYSHQNLSQLAVNALVKDAQKCAYPEVFNIIENSKSLPLSNPLANLSPIIDEHGVLRVGGRLRNSDLTYRQKHPIFLPYKHNLSLAIISHYHHKTGHQGKHITCGALRDAGYYLEKGSKSLKDFIKNCVICRRLRASCETQIMADLPRDRTVEAAPFTNIGIDVMGPWLVTDGKSTRANSGSRKLWALVITCLYSRAVHIEPLPSLDTYAFQNSFRRFQSIRGPCELIRSDRGTNFIGAANDLNFVDISNIFVNNNCRWEFNPAHASHFGGVWERKIGQIKRSLDASILLTSNRKLTADEFYTLLQEAAYIVNCTPLWNISDDPNDPQPLSPAKLLTLKEPSFVSTQEFDHSDLLSYGKKRWRRVCFLSNMFWTNWRKFYLQNLQTRKKWINRNKNVSVGSVVLLKDKTVKRNHWPTGIIEDVKYSTDNLIRSVTVKTAKATKDGIKYLSYRRPISEIVVLLHTDEMHNDP